MAWETVTAQVSLNPMSTPDIASCLRQVFSTPPELQKAESAEIDIELTQPGEGATQEGPADEKPALTPENPEPVCSG